MDYVLIINEVAQWLGLLAIAALVKRDREDAREMDRRHNRGVAALGQLIRKQGVKLSEHLRRDHDER